MIRVTQMMKVLIFGQIQQKNGRQSAILDLIRLKFGALIHSIIVYKFPIHYVYKLWSWVTQMMKVVIFGRIQPKNGRQSAILDLIRLKFGTLIHSIIVYTFPIHYVYKLWSLVTQMMKVLIFGQIQQKHGPLWPPFLGVRGLWGQNCWASLIPHGRFPIPA